MRFQNAPIGIARTIVMVVTRQSGKIEAQSSEMMRLAQKTIVLGLVALVAAGSQAEICPMKLARQLANGCGTAALAMHHADHQTKKLDKADCCPSEHQHVTAQAKTAAAQVTACNSPMTCCSVDPQPASPKSPQFLQPEIGIAPKIATESPLATMAVVPEATTPSFENPVFRHKEDLRI